MHDGYALRPRSHIQTAGFLAIRSSNAPGKREQSSPKPGAATWTCHWRCRLQTGSTTQLGVLVSPGKLVALSVNVGAECRAGGVGVAGLLDLEAHVRDAALDDSPFLLMPRWR